MEEIKKRVLAAICLAPPTAFLFYFLPPKWFFLFLSLVSLLAMFELIGMADIREIYLVLFLAMISLIPLYQKSLNSYLLWILFSPVILMFIKFLRGDSRYESINRDTIRCVNTMLVCEVFIILPLFYLYLLKEIDRYFPLILLLALWASDTCAYFLGRTFGKRLLVPRISPGKTFEGLFGAVIGSTIVTVLSSKLLGMGILESLTIGCAIGILGQMGDIFESIGKRVCEVKDSSSLIPGHGGILDRIDSFIFTTPFLYHYLSGIKG